MQVSRNCNREKQVNIAIYTEIASCTSFALVLAATATASSQELVDIIYIDNGNHQLQAGGDCCQQYGGSGAGGDYLLLLN